MLKIDYWYGHKKKDITFVDVRFNDIDCVYRGNIYHMSRPIGDFVCDNSVELEREFPGIFGKYMLIGAYSDMTETEMVIMVGPGSAVKAGTILKSALTLWGFTEDMEKKGWDPYSTGYEEVAGYYLNKNGIRFMFTSRYNDEDVVWVISQIELPEREEI